MTDKYLPRQQGSGSYRTITIEVHQPFDALRKEAGETDHERYERITAEMERRVERVVADLPSYAKVIDTRAAYAKEVRDRLAYLTNYSGMPDLTAVLDSDEKLIAFAQHTKMRVHLGGE